MSVNVEVMGGVEALLQVNCGFCGAFASYSGKLTMAAPHGTTVLVADLPGGWFRLVNTDSDGDIRTEAICCRPCFFAASDQDWAPSPEPQRYVWRGR